MGERITPDSAVEGDLVRFWWDGEDREAVVVGARPPGKNFVDVQVDDDTVLHGVFNYEVIKRAKPVPHVLEGQIELIAEANEDFHRWLDVQPGVVSRRSVRFALSGRGLGRRGHESAEDSNDPEPLVDSHLRDQIAANLARHLYWHPGRCECGWKVNELGEVDWQAQFRAHVAQSIVDEAVAPVLAAKDAALGWEQTSKQQYVEERDEALDDVERLRSALSKALADLVVRRQALANVLDVTDAGGASGYYRMIQDVADLRAELDTAKSKAKADAGWNEAIDWLLNSRHTADPDIQSAFWGMAEGRFTRKQADTGCFQYDDEGNAHIPTDDEQPDTEATEQAPREPRVWREGDPEPDDVYEVSDRLGVRWSRRHDGFWVGLNKHGFARWDQLLQITVGGLTEVVVDGTQ